MVQRADGLRVITLNTDFCALLLHVSSSSQLTCKKHRVSVGSFCFISLNQSAIRVHNDRSNLFNYINMTNPDTSGMLRFLTDELQEAEDAGDRGQSPSLICIATPDIFSDNEACILVWILGHVLSGWDGTNPLANPTNLCKPYMYSEWSRFAHLTNVIVYQM